ncbi:MAG: hypothetical protein QM784_13855 [Polyangiaceae bacterium]
MESFRKSSEGVFTTGSARGRTHRDSSSTNKQNSQAESASGATRDIGYELRLALGAGLDTAPAPPLFLSGALRAFFGGQENQCLVNQLTLAEVTSSFLFDLDSFTGLRIP